MKKKFTLVFLLIAGGSSLAFAQGEQLFNSPTLGGSKNDASCVTCHAGGEGLNAPLFDRKEYVMMGQTFSTLEDIVNMCIQMPLEGKAIDPNGAEMKHLLNYMKTLTK
ncbi:hypothetical protein JWV37_00895 [Sulfurospirillum sp. T05]|uniref:Cytochrome c domain-containing protein n=1 Tax=Sulfurospirillum tamanense TaxID=2813362 RepID=A0ABS2WQ19_9BACT|nr:hypothetical protein [Sulfurospirillum tamanensis]MBN2963324.1 hypothetical protein [Sulfurospirillum tamanensis]